ncbi:MAG: transglutaminase protein [Herbinix sp.]|nr:transglutaminase protein [Herbinix sp.]
MFEDREKLYQAYRTLLSMALGWALALVINQYFELRVTVFLCAFFSFLPALGVFLIYLNKKNTVTYLVLAGIIPILALILWARKFNPLVWANEYSDWIATYNGSKELYQARFSNITIFMICIIGVIIFFLLTKTQLLKISLAVLLVTVLVLLSINEINISKVVVAICLFYLLSIILECYGIIYARKAGKQEKKESILYLAPICLLLAVLAVAMPSKEEPLQWKAVHSIYDSIKEQIERWSTDLDYYMSEHSTEFFISLTGYSDEDSELANENGALIKNEKVAIKFTGSVRNRPIYLIGSVNDTYTGHSWEKSHTDYLPGEQEYKLDFMELAYALSRQDIVSLENNRYVERVTLKVEYDNIKTKTFFYPLKTSWFNLLSDSTFPEAAPSNITFDKPKGRGTIYEGVFYEMNLNGEQFVKMLEEADTFSYDTAQSVKLDSFRWLESNTLMQDNTNSFVSRWDFYELFRERAKLIKGKYTLLPEGIPNRVKELAEEITAEYDTTYDKLKAIEAYLQKYTYSLSPMNPSEGQDFVDYFLFEGKKGYCTSYATAMAVLGRSIGVPMRYMEGFVAKFEHQDEEDNMYQIKNSQAHAWAEAYFEGVGWIPFEATAPFVSSRYTTWVEEQKAEVPGEGYPGHYEGEIPEGAMPDNGGYVAPELEEEEPTNEVLAGVLATGGAILIILIIILTYYYVLKFRHRKEYNKSDSSRKMYLIFLKILEVLKKEGFHLDEGETILMLAQRVKDHFHYDCITFLEVTNIFMRYRYAEEVVTEEELGRVVLYQNGLVLKRREEQPKLKLWLEEYIFLMRIRNM